MTTSAESWMQVALSLARGAAAMGEVPVGAVIVRDEQIVATGLNRREQRHDPIGHAEIDAISRAAKILGRWRLDDCQLYVTLEPCVMCAGALWQARIGEVFYGAADPKGGAIESLYHMHADERLNHTYQATGGVLADEAAALLKSFFRQRRGQSASQT